MKSQDKQIVEKLQAYDPEMVLKAFTLYKKSLESGSVIIEDELKKDGWVDVDEKPVDIPFYFINGKYWVLTEEAKQRKIEEVKQAAREKRRLPNGIKAVENAKKPKTSMSLKRVQFLCPICQSGLYKQKVCPACKDGKNGYTIRLLCEDNPDHEFLI